jgi:kynureninase
LRVGATIADLVGALAHEVVVCDSTSVNLFKVLGAALRLRPGRRVIIGEIGNFPTDMYVAASVADARAGCYPIVQALIARGVIGDFRAPDILRFGFAGLYVRYADIWDAVAVLKDVMRTRAWDHPEFTARKAVT